MGSIPLIALQGHPAPDPTEQFGRLAQLKGMMQQQQQAAAMAPLQQQEAQLQIQKEKQAQADQQAMTQAMQESKSLDDIPSLILKHGGSAQAAIAFQQNRIAQKKSLADLSKDQFDLQQKQADLYQGAHDQVMKADPADRPQIYQQVVQGLKASGEDTSQLPPDYPGDKNFEMLGHPLRLHSQLLQEADKERELKVKEQEANQKDWEVVSPLGVRVNKTTGETQPIAGATMSPQMMEAKYVALQQKKNLGQGLSPDESAFAKGYEKLKTLVPVANFNMQNAGATGANGQPSAIAKSLAAGEMKWSDAVSARTPMSVKQALLAEVKSIKPDFNSGDFSIEQAVRKDFTSGQDAQKLQAFNTAITHMGIFKDMATKLDNTDVRILNQAGNAIGLQFGSDKVTNFNIAKQAFIGEVSRAFDGAGVTMHDREEVEKQISAAGSPAQLKGAAETAEKLLRGKRDVLQQQYETGKTGKPNFGDQAQGGSNQAAAGPPPGATHMAMGSDGKKHYTNAQGQDLGVVP